MKTTRSLMIVLLILSLLCGVRTASRAQSLKITGLNPSSIQSGPYIITLTGTGFTPTCVAEVEEWVYPVSSTTSYVSPTQLTVSGYCYSASGYMTYTVDVHDTVTNQTSNLSGFSVYPAPSYFSVYPNTIKAGNGNFNITLGAYDNAPQSGAWTFSGITTPLGGYSLSPSGTLCYISASLVAAPGIATVSASGYYPVNFYITGNATVTSLSPNTASAGDHDFTLTINGTGFAPGDQVQWNGTALQTTFLSSTVLLASVPDALVSTTGTAQITAAYAYPVAFTIGTVHVSGKIALEGETNPAQPVTLEFRPTSGTTTTVPVQLAADGSFNVSGIAPGTYNLAVKGYKWLRSVTPITVGYTPLSGVQVSLLGGDANGDNVVDSLDFNVLVGAFGSSVGVPGSGYDVRADFNDDGNIDTLDFNLLIGEYGQAGAP